MIALAACQHKKSSASPIQTIKSRVDPDSAGSFKSLEPRELLNRLFDSPVIQGRTAIWKPNFSETMSSFPLSYDDSCHTTLDTVLYFKDHDNTNCAVVIFATYRFTVDSLDGMKIGIGDCHSCGAAVGMALFSQGTNKRWDIYAFAKFLTVSGVSGGTTDEGIGKFSFVQLGDHWTGLLLEEPVFASTGAEEAGAELYAIEAKNIKGYPQTSLREILSYPYVSSSEEEPGMAARNEHTTLEVVKREKQYYLVRLATTLNGKRWKIKDYHYSDDEDRYVPVSRK